MVNLSNPNQCRKRKQIIIHLVYLFLPLNPYIYVIRYIFLQTIFRYSSRIQYYSWGNPNFQLNVVIYYIGLKIFFLLFFINRSTDYLSCVQIIWRIRSYNFWFLYNCLRRFYIGFYVIIMDNCRGDWRKKFMFVWVLLILEIDFRFWWEDRIIVDISNGVLLIVDPRNCGRFGGR